MELPELKRNFTGTAAGAAVGAGATEVKTVEVYALATLGLQAIAAMSALGIFLVQVHAIHKLKRPVMLNKGRKRKGRR